MQKAIEEMDAVVKNTIDMAELTAGMIERSIKALSEDDKELASSVMDTFGKVDCYDRCIEEKALRILCLYQPRATDMRTMATVLKCITYLERIAKYSRNISSAVRNLNGTVPAEYVNSVVTMGDTAVSMVRMVIGGFKNRSVDGFDRLQEMDDTLDEGLRNNYESFIAYIKENPSSADDSIYCLSMMKYIERIGDHACKIAEKVTYMVTGFHTVIV